LNVNNNLNSYFFWIMMIAMARLILSFCSFIAI
jgi:hypothetical protein